MYTAPTIRTCERQIADVRLFLAVAGPLLLADEARHNLILGLAGTLRDGPPCTQITSAEIAFE